MALPEIGFAVRLFDTRGRLRRHQSTSSYTVTAGCASRVIARPASIATVTGPDTTRCHRFAPGYSDSAVASATRHWAARVNQ